MSFPVPYRKKSEIEAMALDLLQRYQMWKASPILPPIDIDEIVEGYLKINLQLADLKKLLYIPDVLGATWFEDKVIRVDSSLEGKEGRLSFTMAHEVGHWWMHRPIYEMEKITLPIFAYEKEKKPSPAVRCRSIGKKEPAEWQADQFAAMLLMPASVVRSSVLSLHNGPARIDGLEKEFTNASENQSLRGTAKHIIESYTFSNVSIEAMCYRLIELKLVVDSDSRQLAFLE